MELLLSPTGLSNTGYHIQWLRLELQVHFRFFRLFLGRRDSFFSWADSSGIGRNEVSYFIIACTDIVAPIRYRTALREVSLTS